MNRRTFRIATLLAAALAVARFSLLVLDDKLGAQILEAAPPKR